MLWPFKQFRKPPAVSRGTIEAIYGTIVAQARDPAFYARWGVPDTVNGRFDLVVLHLWLVLRRLRAGGDLDGAGQALIDHFCSDMDDNLRELGTSDLKVPKRILEFSEAFYGRARAYDAAFADPATAAALAAALNRNIYGRERAEHSSRLAAYVIAAAAALGATDIKAIRDGDWRFPSLSRGDADGATM